VATHPGLSLILYFPKRANGGTFPLQGNTFISKTFFLFPPQKAPPSLIPRPFIFRGRAFKFPLSPLFHRAFKFPSFISFTPIFSFLFNFGSTFFQLGPTFRHSFWDTFILYFNLSFGLHFLLYFHKFPPHQFWASGGTLSSLTFFYPSKTLPPSLSKVRGH